jgi:HEAT repeat protein
MKQVLILVAVMVMIFSIGCDQSNKIVTDMELGRDYLNGSGSLNDAVRHLKKAKDTEQNPTEARVLLAVAYFYGLSTGDAIALGQATEYKRDGQALASSLGDAELQAILDLLTERRRYHKGAMDAIVAAGGNAVPVLVSAFATSLYTKIQGEVEEMLLRLGQKDIIPIVDELENLSLTEARKIKLVRVIGKINNLSSKQKLVSFRGDTSGALQMEVDATLYQLGEKEYRSGLITGLSSSDLEERRVAARAMSLVDESPTDDILKTMKDDDVLVRLHSVNALALHPSKTALDPVLNLLVSDPDVSVKQAATAAAIEHIEKGYGKGLAKRLVNMVKELENPDDRLRVIKLIRTDRIRNQIKINKFENLEYQIYEYMEGKEQNEMVKRELNFLLNDLDGAE